jgi:integrase/recombinase XerD
VKKIPIDDLPGHWPPRARGLYREFAQRIQIRVKDPITYLRCLNRFLRLQSRMGFGYRDFPTRLIDQAMTPCTPRKRLHLTLIRAWMRFLYQRHELLLPLHENLGPYPFPPKGRRALLNHEQVRRVLALPPLTEALGLRDRAMLEMAYGSGLRRFELSALDLGDLDLALGLVTVRQPKNYHQRTVPLTRWCLHYLQRYLEEARPQLLSPLSSNALWLTETGRRTDRRTLSERFKNPYRSQNVLDFPFTPHQLRHACATQLLNAGASIRQVQEMLGHRCLQSTEVYTHLTPIRLREQHQNCHPRNLTPFPPGPNPTRAE